MSLRDFLRERAVVVRGSQRFIVTKPKLRTIIALLSRFPAQVYSIRKVYAESEEPISVEDLVPVFVAGDRTAAAEVLETCCELHGGYPGEVVDCLKANDDLILRVIYAALSLCDPERIASSLDLDRVDDPAPSDPSTELADPGPTDQEISIVVLAERFGCEPTEVMEWPYESFLSTSEILPLISGVPGESRREDSGELVTDQFSHIGLGVRTVGEA